LYPKEFDSGILVLAEAPLTDVALSAIAPTAIAAITLGQLFTKRCEKATTTPHFG
jgi:hypothetical protein